MWQPSLVTTKVCVFFDVDNILILTKIMFRFLSYLQRGAHLLSAECLFG